MTNAKILIFQKQDVKWLLPLMSSSDSSRMSTEYMELIVEKLERKAYKNPTLQNYYTIWCLFNKFLVALDKLPESWEGMSSNK